MKLNTLLIINIPPVSVAGTIAVLKPSALTRPMAALLSFVFGVLGALTLRLFD